MKRCPFCAEEIQDNAIKCKHCGERLLDRNIDTLDRAVTLPGTKPGKGGNWQYDTLDVAVTEGGQATILAGQYRILKKLGEGGMGMVYLAEDMELDNRQVAIKVLPPLLARNARAVENLRKEALTTINLNHPNIIRLYGFHSDGEIKFLVMEYIDGETLEDMISSRPNGKLSFTETIHIAEQVAAGLDHAHSQNPSVIHRDLKPSNIMINKAGHVKVLDFGIAREMKDSYTRVTGKQETSGTLPYMSPEQLRGKKPSAGMDIYSLGIVCYECLNGKPPFFTGQIDYQILNEEPGDIEGQDDYINSALRKILRKDPADRPKTASGVIELLRKRQQPQIRAEVREQKAPDDACEILQGGSPFDVTNSIGMKLVYIPPGEFMMGSPANETNREGNEGPQHRVKISKSFYMGIYEVTQVQWQAVMGSNPSHFKGDNLPVETVSWGDAVEFCRKLSQKEGKTYRLPTEAEWEYACRAGSTTRFCFGDSDAGLDGYGW
jgi:eukaryotic-like serine/threonine-protein kinase